MRDDIYESDNLDIICRIKHPELNGLFIVAFMRNIEVQGPEYFLIYTTTGDSFYIDENSRICRVYADKPEYLLGHNENCKLTKIEKDLFIKSLTTDNFHIFKGQTGWDTRVEEHNSWKEWVCANEKRDYVPDTFDMPDYNLLETED